MYTEIQKVLTAAQKTKVQALVEAMRLQGVICEAQTYSILPQAFPGNVIPANRLLPDQGFASFLLGGVGLQYGGCAPAFRSGAFLP